MKKLAFSLMATVIGVLSMNAQNAPRNFLKIDLGFGKVSSYAGPCVSAAGMCSGSADQSTTFQAAISRISETEVAYAFSPEFVQKNANYLKNGLSVGTSFSLPKTISEAIGLKGEYIIPRGTYYLKEKEGYYVLTIPRG